MIRGIVNARREAVVALHVRGPNGLEEKLDAIIDTGFSASLTLPAEFIARLGLIRQSGTRAVLADGSVRQFDIFAAEIRWEKEWRSILVSAVGEVTLAGMRLLADHELRIVVVPDGVVEIAPVTGSN